MILRSIFQYAAGIFGLVVLTTCGDPQVLPNRIIVSVAGLPDAAVTMQVLVLSQGKVATDFPKLTLSFPPGKTTTNFALALPEEEFAAGQLSVALGVFRGNKCLVATGMSSVHRSLLEGSIDISLNSVTPPAQPCSDLLPIVTEITPDHAKTQSEGTITLSGFGFLPGVSLSVGSQPLNSPTFVSPLQATGVLPRLSGQAGPQVISVQNPGMEKIQRTGLLTLTVSVVDFYAQRLVDVGTSGNPCRIAIADVDGDSYPDIIGSVDARNSSTKGAIHIYKNMIRSCEVKAGIEKCFDLQSLDYPIARTTIGLIAGQLDSDNITDIALLSTQETSPSAQLAIFHGDTDKLFVSKPDHTYEIPSGFKPRSFALGDINGDSAPDVLVLAMDSMAKMYAIKFHNTPPTLKQEEPLPIKPSVDPTAMDIADLDNDGKPEIIISNSGSGIEIFPGSKLTAAPIFYSKEVIGHLPIPKHLLADLNNDRLLDLVIPWTVNYQASPVDSPNLVLVYMNSSEIGGDMARPTLKSSPNSYMIPFGTATAAAVDLDLDGALDLLIANRDFSEVQTPTGPSTASITVLYGKGDGTFDLLRPQVSRIFLGYGAKPEDIAVADFNKDGLPDIALGTSGHGAVTVLMNKSM